MYLRSCAFLGCVRWDLKNKYFLEVKQIVYIFITSKLRDNDRCGSHGSVVVNLSKPNLKVHYMCNGPITVMVIYTASAGPGGPITLHPITITPLHITAAHYTLGRGRETLKHEFVVILCSPP